MEQQLEPFKRTYLQDINRQLSYSEHYVFIRSSEIFYEGNKEEIIKFLSLKTNGIEIDTYEELPYDNKFNILLEYFYFGMCPSLLPNPRENFISHYFMWVKKNDTRVLEKFNLVDDILKAIREHDTQRVIYFIDNGIEQNKLLDVYRVLITTFNNPDLIKYFIENTIIDLKEAFKIYISGWNINNEIIDAFINKGLDKNRILLYIIFHGKTDFIKYILEKGADLILLYESSKSADKTLLILGINSENLDMVKYLVNNNIPITELDLEYAKNYPRILKYLQSLYKKPYKKINSTCNVENLSDNDVENIARKMNIKIIKTNGKIQNKTTLCKNIADYFQKASEYMRDNVNKCITESTLSGDFIGDIHPLFFTMYKQGNHIHCGDIRELVRLRKNPVNRIPFTRDQMYTFKEKMEILKSFIENLDDSEEIVMTTLGLIRNATLIFTGLLRYPNPIHLYTDASENTIEKFIVDLSDIGILNGSDLNSLKSAVNLNTKKIALANVLTDKLKNASDINYINGVGISSVSVTLEEIYNNNFKTIENAIENLN